MFNRKALLFGFLAVFLYASSAYSQTEIGGTKREDLTLTKAESPYALSSNLVIRGATLTMEPGVIIDLKNRTITIGYSNSPSRLDASNVTFTNSSSADEYIHFRHGTDF